MICAMTSRREIALRRDCAMLARFALARFLSMNAWIWAWAARREVIEEAGGSGGAIEAGGRKCRAGGGAGE